MQEQSIGADQISDSITQLNEAIQENSTFASETSETANELHNHSAALTDAVAHFAGTKTDYQEDEATEDSSPLAA